MTIRTVLLVGMAAGAAAAGCSLAVQRDLQGHTPSQVVFDDACGVQDYYDTIALRKAAPPTVEITSEIEARQGRRSRGGRTRYSFMTDYQLKMVRKILSENYKHVPDEVLSESPVKIEVFWSEKAGVKRVVTDRDAELIVGGSQWALPTHPCLSELLFGEDLYRTRRTLLGLPPLKPATAVRAPAAAPPAAPVAPPAVPAADGGAPDGGR